MEFKYKKGHFFVLQSRIFFTTASLYVPILTFLLTIVSLYQEMMSVYLTTIKHVLCILSLHLAILSFKHLNWLHTQVIIARCKLRTISPPPIAVFFVFSNKHVRSNYRITFFSLMKNWKDKSSFTSLRLLRLLTPKWDFANDFYRKMTLIILNQYHWSLQSHIKRPRQTRRDRPDLKN